MKFKRLIVIVLSLIMIMGTLAGCNGKKEDGTGSTDTPPTDVSEKDADQYLNLFLLNPLTLDNNDARNTSEFQIINEVQEGLARVFINKDGIEVLEPAGAESWDLADDEVTWTFNLRDHKWSDGEKVTAQQYVDSFVRLLDPEKAFSYAFFAYDIKNAEAYYEGTAKVEDIGVKAIDENTLQIVLEKPAPQFEKKIAFVCLFPIRLDIIEAGGETWATDHTKHVYNGPFIIKDWVKENSIILEKNPNYWDAENVNLQTVEMTIVDEFSTKAQLFEAKQMDVIEAEGDYTTKWVDMAGKGDFQYIHGNSPAMYFVGFNQKTNGMSGIMGNKKVRKALSLAIDREEFTEALYNRNYPGYGLIPKGIVIGDVEFRDKFEDPLRKEYEKYNGDPAKLQELLKEGLKELGMDEDLSKIELVFITTGASALDKSIQEYWQQTWQNKLGIKIVMNAFGDSKAFRDIRNKDEYDILSNGWHGDYNDPMTFADIWISDGGFSKFFGWYSSEEYDNLFKTLDGETDMDKRGEIYSQLENLLVVEDSGIAPYMYLDSRHFVHNYVKDIYFPMFGPVVEFSRAYTVGR